MPRQLQLSEKSALYNLKADSTINSGATFEDADGVIHGKYGYYSQNGFLVEVKSTAKKSYSLKLAEVLKLRQQAANEQRTPLFAITIQNEQYVILEILHFRDLLDWQDELTAKLADKTLQNTNLEKEVIALRKELLETQAKLAASELKVETMREVFL